MTRPFHRLTAADGERGRVGIRIRRGERNRNENHTDVHQHAAVSSTDEPSQALTAGSQHELPTRSSAGESAQEKRQQRSEPISTNHDRNRKRHNPAPRWPKQPVT